MKGLIILIVVVGVFGAGWYFYSQSRPAPTGETPSSLAPASGSNVPETLVSGGGKEVTVEMTPAGFSPATLTVKAGDTVKFVNKDNKDRWPASGIHPTHQLCPGFDALKPLKTGEEYSFTFSQEKECPMHDHLNPAFRGKITVE